MRAPRTIDVIAAPELDMVVHAREGARLSVEEAAAVVHAKPSEWRAWESGARRMHPGLWVMFFEKNAKRADPERRTGVLEPEYFAMIERERVETYGDRWPHPHAIRRNRIIRQLTQAEAAAAVGERLEDWALWEAGERSGPADLLARLDNKFPIIF